MKFFMHALINKKINLKEATVTEINCHPHYLYLLIQLKIKLHCIAKDLHLKMSVNIYLKFSNKCYHKSQL